MNKLIKSIYSYSRFIFIIIFFQKLSAGAVLPEDSDSDEGVRDGAGHMGGTQSEFVSDFDLMMEQQKAMKRRRRKKDIDLINDNDDAIAKMIADMRLAAREDREKNAERQPATKKISMLPSE